MITADASCTRPVGTGAGQLAAQLLHACIQVDGVTLL